MENLVIAIMIICFIVYISTKINIMENFPMSGGTMTQLKSTSVKTCDCGEKCDCENGCNCIDCKCNCINCSKRQRKRMN